MSIILKVFNQYQNFWNIILSKLLKKSLINIDFFLILKESYSYWYKYQILIFKKKNMKINYNSGLKTSMISNNEHSRNI